MKSRKTTATCTQEDTGVGLGISHIDSLLDRIRHNKIRSFDAAHVAQLRKLSNHEIKKLSKKYDLSLLGMQSALHGDEYDLEAYQHFSHEQLKLAVRYLKHLHTMKHDVSATGKIRVLGTARKKKEQRPEDLAKKVQYLEYDPETGVRGMNPADFIGKQQMWVYNTKARKLGCYYALNAHGLSCKGTTITNYDEAQSTTKVLRKPKEQIWKFMSSGLKFWKNIRTVSQKISPRLNRDTLIIKVA